MAYRKSGTIYNRRIDKTGFTNYDDVYGIINDNVDKISEFYEIEPAMVLEVLLDPHSPNFPTKDFEGDKIPDYSYLGTIRARFIYSQNTGDEISDYIKPLSTHISVYPTKGEIVNVTKHAGQYYYYHPLNLRNLTNMNRAVGERGEGLVLPMRTKFNRKLLGEQGDLVINGRFGQGIKFGSDENYFKPTIKITNNQNPNDDVSDEKLAERYYPHNQDINTDGSSIYFTSGLTTNENETLEIAAGDEEQIDFPKSWPPSVGGIMNGDMITINSDKIVINAKGSFGDTHISAVRSVNLSAIDSINLEVPEAGGVITLGSPDANNPVVKGLELLVLFKDLFTKIDFFLNAISDGGVDQIQSAAKNLKTNLDDLEKDILPDILSQKVYIDDDRDEDLENE